MPLSHSPPPLQIILSTGGGAHGKGKLERGGAKGKEGLSQLD